MTRLVLVVPQFPRLSETFIVSKFLGLLQAGWDVHIVCQHFSSREWAEFAQLRERPELRQRVHVAWRQSPRLAAGGLWPVAAVETAVRAPQAMVDYWQQGGHVLGNRLPKRFYLDARLIALQPDILHFEFGSLSVGRTYLKELLGCRLTASFRGYDLNYVGLDVPGYYDELWQTADALHFLGDDLWQRALRRGCPPDMPHALIPPAIDTAYFDPAQESARPVDPDGPLRVLSVGRLAWKKGHEYSLQAMALLQAQGIPATLRIIGDGPYAEPLAFARYELGLQDGVTFLGGQPREIVRREMAMADVLLHAAVSEGFCNAVIEAQAMQLPVVTSDADGLPANVRDGETGFVVPRRDAAALAGRLALLAEDPELRHRMGMAGRERVVHCFRIEDQIVAFDHFYRERVVDHAR